MTFVVGDYIQLQFNPPPILNAYSLLAVRENGRETTKGEEPFANLLVSQLGKLVAAVRLLPERIVVSLEDGVEILVFLRPDDPFETAELFGRDGQGLVFRGDGTILSGVEHRDEAAAR